MISEILAFVAPSFMPNELRTATALRFSEAILLGCETTVADPHQYLGLGNSLEPNPRACVLGAAIKGAGWEGRWHPQISSHREFYEKHFGTYGALHHAYRAKFATNFEQDLLHGMSREQIAMRFEAIGL